MAGVHTDLITEGRGAEADHDLVAQPHQQKGPVAEAETTAAEMSSDERPLGRLGRRFAPRSPFFVGMEAAAGVAVPYGAVRLLESMSSVLVLIGVAFFLALGLEPAASWFVNHKLPRWGATTLVFLIFLALLGAFVGAAIPPLVQQAGELIHQAPQYIQQAQDHSSAVGRLNERFHLQQRITDALNSSGGSLLNDVVSSGTAVFKAVADGPIVGGLTVDFLVDMT